MSDWLPIETAPNDGTEVDVWVPDTSGGYRVPNAWWSKADARWRSYDDNRLMWQAQPTHWMPKPQGPKV